MLSVDVFKMNKFSLIDVKPHRFNNIDFTVLLTVVTARQCYLFGVNNTEQPALVQLSNCIKKDNQEQIFYGSSSIFYNQLN